MEDIIRELYKYIKFLYIRRYYFIAISVLVMSCGIAFVYHMPKKYLADSTVFIEDNVIKQLIKGIAITPDMDSRINTLKYSLLSREFLLKVIKSIDIDISEKNQTAINDFISGLQRRTNVEIKGEGNRKDLFRVSIVDENPDFAQKYINTLVGAFVEQNIFSKRQETYGANRFLDEQLLLFKKKLDVAEDAIIDFRKKQGIFSNFDEKIMLTNINDYDHSIEELGLTIETLKARRNRLVSQSKRVTPTIALFSEKQTENRIATLKNRIAQLLVTYTEDYPEVVKLRAEMESLQNAEEPREPSPESTTMAVNPLYQDLQQKIYDLEAEISATVARRDRIKQLKSQKEFDLQNTPETMKQLAMLTQERNTYKRLYEELLMRAGQSEVSKQMEIGDKATTFRIVDPALFPEEPVAPDMVRMILAVIALGISAGLGMVIVLENFDSSVKDVHQLSGLGVAVLSVVPRIPDEIRSRSSRRRDLLVYLAASVYFSGILGLLGFEFLKQIGRL